jgi:hypothetical protein
LNRNLQAFTPWIGRLSLRTIRHCCGRFSRARYRGEGDAFVLML